MTDSHTTAEERIERSAHTTGDGEYTPAGEGQGADARFTADQVAHAFEVEVQRVHHAFQGEYDLAPDGTVDSRQAQDLAELMLTDHAQDVRQAALMRLGAFTPRSDHDWGAGEKAPGEESSRVERQSIEHDGERGPAPGSEESAPLD